ncbi:hypothetical protein V6N13_025983 [Hibiscus sabdariffa]
MPLAAAWLRLATEVLGLPSAHASAFIGVPSALCVCCFGRPCLATQFQEPAWLGFGVMSPHKRLCVLRVGPCGCCCCEPESPLGVRQRPFSLVRLMRCSHTPLQVRLACALALLHAPFGLYVPAKRSLRTSVHSYWPLGAWPYRTPLCMSLSYLAARSPAISRLALTHTPVCLIDAPWCAPFGPTVPAPVGLLCAHARCTLASFPWHHVCLIDPAPLGPIHALNAITCCASLFTVFNTPPGPSF